MLSTPLCLREGTVPVLVLEDPRLFRSLVFELSSQAQGEPGNFLLSLDYEPLDCVEHLRVLRDYLQLPLEDRRLQNRFWSRVQWTMRELLAPQTDALQQQISGYLQQVAVALDRPVRFSEGEYLPPLLKALRCAPVLDGETPLERLIQYLELCSDLLKDQCFVLVNAHLYFSDAELTELFRMAGYEKWKLLLIERRLSTPLPMESVCLLDSSLCELRLDLPDEIG